MTIEEHRQSQSVEEAKFKYLKAKGRHSKNYWIQEYVDLAVAEGRELYEFFKQKVENSLGED